MNVVRLPLACSLAAALLVPTLAGCQKSDDDDGFVLRTTEHAASPGAAITLQGLWLVYLASEAFDSFGGLTGTDLNGDTDKIDDVAVAVNLSSTVATVLGVAAEGAAIVADEIFLIVDEAEDGVDWNAANGATELVLLHWSSATGAPTFVDVLDLEPNEQPRVVEDRLYYASATPLGAVDETSLRYVTRAAPTTPVAVLNTLGAGDVEAHLLGEEDGVLFCSLDEVSNALVLNEDGDSTDVVVLALLDGTDPDGRLSNVKKALASASAPVAAHVLGANHWLVAFLVDETAQGGVNLNDQALFLPQLLLPESCLGTPDPDTNDQILHYLEFTDVPTTPVNTGLVGEERVLAFAGFVAAVSSEADSNCDLNEDGDTTDQVARWVATTLPVAPERDAALMHALETTLPGGSHGLTVLDDRLIAVVDEAADETDLDGVPGQDFDLVGWIDPAATTPAWDFSHQSSECTHGTGIFVGGDPSNPCDGVSEPFAGTSWMAAESVGGRLGLTFLEAVPATNVGVGSLNTNLDCALVAKDTDKTDALPVWADFESGPTLDFDGVGYAVDAANPGIEIAAGFAFFRVSEVDDNLDYNDDGAENDVVLFANPLTTCGPLPLATSSSIVSPVITTDRALGAAFLSSEAQAGFDFNDDGDLSDLVVRYFLL